MNALDTAIYTKLQTNGTITALLSGTTAIYSVQAKNAETFPYIVFNVQGGGDENLDAHRTKNFVVYIRAYARGNKAQAGSIDSAFDAVLHLQSINVSGWANFWLAREQDLETAQVMANGETIFSVGALYRVRLEKT